MRVHRMTVLVLVAVVLLNTGCGCGETGIGGDTGIDVHRDSMSSEPSFDPPIENLGDPGWRDSTEPWCVSGEMRRNGYDLWSDHRGVFVILDLYDASGGPGWAEHTIYFNGGTGWGPYITGTSTDYEICVNALTGMPGGALLGWDTNAASCQLTTIVDGVERSEGFAVYDVVAVSEELAYAIPVGDPRIVKYEGGTWGPLPGDPVPYDVHRIWADEEIIFAAGDSGVMISNEGGSWTVHDTRTMDHFVSLWGFSAEDVWAGTTYPGGLYHYDGTSWEPVDWPDPSDPDERCDGPEIRGFWGKDGVLFFHTGSAFVRWDGEEFAVLGHWPMHEVAVGTGFDCRGGLGIAAIWGNEVDEVFLAVSGFEVYDEDCGEEFLLWWDGSEFHWF